MMNICFFLICFFMRSHPKLLYCLLYSPSKAPTDSAALSFFFPSPVFHSVCVLPVQELERFKSFVKRKPAFDVVVDGLNVANVNKDKSRQSETVQTCEAAHQRSDYILISAVSPRLRACSTSVGGQGGSFLSVAE